MRNPSVSFVISTRNRRDVLLRTLTHIAACGLPPWEFETFVVDNASTDHTPGAVRVNFPKVNLIARRSNGGAVARNDALPKCRGTYVVFLDDDSFPMPGAVRRMIEKFNDRPRLGAAVFSVVLPDGRQECSAYPDVFIGCGTGFRRAALDQVGGLPSDFFMQAEEYDLSLRLLDAGWAVQRFDDLIVHHLKTPTARRSSRTTRLDVRNNLLLAARRFPLPAAIRLGIDWTRRYWWIARTQNHRLAFVGGLVQGAVRGLFDRINPLSRQRKIVSPATMLRFTRREQIRSTLQSARERRGVCKVVFIDAGKNLSMFLAAARDAGVQVLAIADDKLTATGRRFGGVPIVSDAIARAMDFDAAVVSNLSPVHAETRRTTWRRATGRPVIDILEFESEFQPALPAGIAENKLAVVAPADTGNPTAGAGDSLLGAGNPLLGAGEPLTGASQPLTGAGPAEARSRRTAARTASRAA